MTIVPISSMRPIITQPVRARVRSGCPGARTRAFGAPVEPAGHSGERAGDAHAPGVWSNAGVFVRVWEYQVPGDRTEAFTAAYAADGAWGELFDKATGFLGTELYRDAARAGRFLTIDRWQDEQDWRSFLHAFGPAYEALDAQLEGLAAVERSL